MSRDSIEIIRMRGAKSAFDGFIRKNTENVSTTEFRTAAESTPFTLMSLGLGSGIATLAAKEKRRLELAAMIARWLLHDCEHSVFHEPTIRVDNDIGWVKALLDRIHTSSRSEYRAAQEEALGFAGWIKRLSQAFCPKDANE